MRNMGGAGGMTAAEAHIAYRETRFFASLDGLRAICIFMVLWHHSTLLYAVAESGPFFINRGFTGVDFFFVLSGFLITRLLLDEFDKVDARTIHFPVTVESDGEITVTYRVRYTW